MHIYKMGLGLPRRLGKLTTWTALALLPFLVSMTSAGAANATVTHTSTTHTSTTHASPAVIPAPSTAPHFASAAAEATAASECAVYAYKAGFPVDSLTETAKGEVNTLVVAIAIALAESSCEPGASNGGPLGIYQINPADWTDISESTGCFTNAQCNADAAANYVYVQFGEGNSFCAWQTFDDTAGCSYTGFAYDSAWQQYQSAAQTAFDDLDVELGNAVTGYCVAADGQDADSGGVIWQYGCSSTNVYDEWHVEQGASNLNPVLKNVGTGLCLDVEASQAENQGTIFQWTCNTTGDAHQRWQVDGNPTPNASFNADLTLRDSTGGNGTCLAADGSQAYPNGIVWQWTCSGYSTNKYLNWN